MALLFAAGICLLFASAALADASDMGPKPYNTRVIQLPQGATPQSPFPPPIGSGPAPRPEIQGDAAPQNVVSGQADNTNGSKFGTQPEQWEAPRNINTGEDPPVRSHTTSPAVTDGKILQTLPTVRMFCRYLVIVGVVMACVFMIFAAASVILGHKGAGERVIQSASGLIILLMGFTIWKVIYMNMQRLEPDGPWDQVTTFAPRDLKALEQNDTPSPPGGGGAGRAQRPGPPVSPYAGGTNNKAP
jgi:hypothetical protein